MIKYCFLFLLTCCYCFANAQITMGLIQQEEEAFEGYTLFSNNEVTYLIDNCGRKVRNWTSEFKAGHGVYLLPHGDLLRAGTLPGIFNAGGRGGVFELFNWQGQLIWQFEIANEIRQAHHDLAPLPNGNFLCTIWEIKTATEAQQKGRQYDGEVWSERILEIEILANNQANIVWEWSIWDHLIQDHNPNKDNYGSVKDHPELLDINYIGQGEATEGNWLHFNSIAYNESLDQIMLSCRNLSEIYVIDHSTTTVEAAEHTGGRSGRGGDILYRFGNPQVFKRGDESGRILGHQHDANWVAEESDWPGAISVFNNKYIEGNQSQIIIFNNPIDKNGNYDFDQEHGFGEETILRSYTDESLYSDILSGVQILPNNNLLILEGRAGRIIELNQEDEIVWEYMNPVNRNGGPGIQGGTPKFNSLFRAIRYAPNYSGLTDKILSPTVPIEISPVESDCEYVTPIEPEENAIAIQLIANIVHDNLSIELTGTQETEEIFLFNSNGILLKSWYIYPGLNELDLSHAPSGLYMVTGQFESKKFIRI